MGGGNWIHASYVNHSTTARGFSSMDDFKRASTQELYRSRKLNSILNPYKVIRECCDSDEHPNTIPVILALDVTGSMGSAASAVATQLGDIMADIFSDVKDVEFMTMAIGDLSYDDAPIQASQFESDIRIAEQLEKVYFEGGGGGNSFESYTAAWYFGLNNTKLDCWNRGKKGIIITMGDEPMNPYLPADRLSKVLGCSIQGDVDTKDLYYEVIEKFDVYHLAIDDDRTSYRRYASRIQSSFGQLLGDNLKVVNCNQLGGVIADIVKSHETTSSTVEFSNNTNSKSGKVHNGEDGISW